jgi:Txe/YoeB family toxin of Txe-Axe toxin-antitoxin module
MCSDNASSYVWAFLLCTQDAKSIINKIDKEIFQIYGAYEEIAYDGAQQLCGVEMAGFLKMWDLRGVQIHVGQKSSTRCKGDISRLRKAMKKVSEESARTWPHNIKRVLLNSNSSPIPAWKSTITPFEIMFHRTPSILARPSLPEYQGMTEHLQEMARGQTRMQDICRELCERTPRGTNPGSGLQTPETLKFGNLVLISREIVATNKINSVLKLTRIYSSKDYKIIRVSGNHVSVQIDKGSHVYH